ncbi:hypothetical protein HS088_TW13G00009 [Tripterygium wilfordii]|uniref:Uncharacterized protein n=1 Tax=Tripterygium wilfordii TaxID=458696 RepID=A0A7J7CST4_TRIWF|nr:hypothetical protein HS088_TW13G00009 [Tripterygium wilfordii]
MTSTISSQTNATPTRNAATSPRLCGGPPRGSAALVLSASAAKEDGSWFVSMTHRETILAPVLWMEATDLLLPPPPQFRCTPSPLIINMISNLLLSSHICYY